MSAVPDLLPTVEGKVTGIVCLDPLTLQCGECGVTVSNDDGRKPGAFIILAGFVFHAAHDPSDYTRRCPPCHRKLAQHCDRCRRET